MGQMVVHIANIAEFLYPILYVMVNGVMLPVWFYGSLCFFLSLVSSFFYEPLPFSVFHYYERSRTTPTRNKNVLFTFVL